MKTESSLLSQLSTACLYAENKNVGGRTIDHILEATIKEAEDEDHKEEDQLPCDHNNRIFESLSLQLSEIPKIPKPKKKFLVSFEHSIFKAS